MEKYNENQEKKLIFNLKNGSHTAFDSIYKLYAKRLYAYSLQYTKSVEDAEDIVQEVFINLWNNRMTIRQDDTLSALLFIMAKHKLINAYRARLNHPHSEEYKEFMHALTVDDTQQRVEYGDFVKHFTKILSKLPPTQQRVIQLSRFNRMTNKEIAETLSLSEQTVKNQLSIGLKSLREKLMRIIVLCVLFVIPW
ncbi:RNA polymerase sigma factor [Microbacter margulisiae]|uniref:RNA polymerase sigma-70 factor (ECF subfamily) n=1 Tax=Microbacter margulisiae TaxID=1350067 RepID=A0A7W5H1N4_9PORP|nr:RNA polymerase sigma-70 factor [Microbacter margulisiae]MBB3186557.1 RNA polymerase sigma-70 factor (ECF subfamily) [Microbacter margulisiae]